MKIISYKLKRELIKQKALGTAENKNIYIWKVRKKFYIILKPKIYLNPDQANICVLAQLYLFKWQRQRCVCS